MARPVLFDGARILFQGDSITDADRDRNDFHSLGHGYAMMIAARLSAQYPEMQLTFLNRGNSGDRVYNLEERWAADCLMLNPSCVSVLIGINDTGLRYCPHSKRISPIDEYENCYRRILQETQRETDATMVICEPFVLPWPIDRATWREDFDPRIDVGRRLAREFQAIYIPFDGMFAAASTKRSCDFWLTDGVHPSLAGQALMAELWIKTVIG